VVSTTVVAAAVTGTAVQRSIVINNEVHVSRLAAQVNVTCSVFGSDAGICKFPVNFEGDRMRMFGIFVIRARDETDCWLYLF
jgi:hypothetical protein